MILLTSRKRLFETLDLIGFSLFLPELLPLRTSYATETDWIVSVAQVTGEEC